MEKRRNKRTKNYQQELTAVSWRLSPPCRCRERRKVRVIELPAGGHFPGGGSVNGAAFVFALAAVPLHNPSDSDR